MKWRDLPAVSRTLAVDVLREKRDDLVSFSNVIATRAQWDIDASNERQRIGAEIAAIDAAVEALEVAP